MARAAVGGGNANDILSRSFTWKNNLYRWSRDTTIEPRDTADSNSTGELPISMLCNVNFVGNLVCLQYTPNTHRRFEHVLAVLAEHEAL